MSQNVSHEGTIDIARDWPSLLAAVSGLVVLTRRFARPTGLAGDTRVELVIGPASTDHLTIWLNDEPLYGVGHGDEWRSDITARLAARNALRIQLDTHRLPIAQLDQVRLEILASSTASRVK